MKVLKQIGRPLEKKENMQEAEKDEQSHLGDFR